MQRRSPLWMVGDLMALHVQSAWGLSGQWCVCTPACFQTHSAVPGTCRLAVATQLGALGSGPGLPDVHTAWLWKTGLDSAVLLPEASRLQV